jgi:hypothetical protein
MGISRVKDFFGVKYAIPRDITTKVPTGALLRCIQGVTFNMNTETIKNNGGDRHSPWATERGPSDPELTMEVQEISSGIFNTFDNATITENAAESGGNIDALANTSGTSILNGSNGISAVAVSSTNQANLKAGTYIFEKGTLATDINISVAGLVDPFDNTRSLVAEDIDCSTPGTVEVAELGLELTVAGTPVFVEGDAAIAENVRPINTGSNIIEVGNSDNPDLLHLTLVFPKQSTGDIYLIDFPKVFVSGGLPLTFNSFEFSPTTITATPMEDANKVLYTISQIFTGSLS